MVGELRAGKSFAAAVQEYSPPTRGSRSRNGELGTFEPREIKEDIATAISNLKVGEVTEPLRVPDGFQIIRLDDRKPPIVPPYENPEVQEAIGRELTMERAEEARKKYMKKLRRGGSGDRSSLHKPKPRSTINTQGSCGTEAFLFAGPI